MTPARFEQLLSWIAPVIVKSSKIRNVTSPSERLCITLRYLTTGDAQITIGSSYRVSPPTVSRIIREKYVPDTESKWKEIANEFKDRWNFPHCLGAIDDIGDAGRQSDGGVYKNSKLAQALETNSINSDLLIEFVSRAPAKIKDAGNKLYPYVFVTDYAFQLKPHMLKPFARLASCIKKKIFNYRLLRARRIIEHCFGISEARFRIFRRPIIVQVETVNLITKAVVALHNFLMKSQENHGEYRYCPPGFVDTENGADSQLEDWRNETNGYTGFLHIGTTRSNSYTKSAKDVRKEYKDYFNTQEGAVSWQWDYVSRTIDPFDLEV
ncbi:uncharacterized protein LOC130648669 [Hydractinia symbiolongicarpus]|uniref:uncharacterized protein LOC130648628 n=1 Tax=Hydractinia symbiolongicarpus TaxID=13093 RepID=UPI00254E0A0A|nr:uncharacterized protein LOC130648628 [Hydractinia symbiolongicarpus]XP_057310707.1 uncharacterized protein LOC130648669 [Hydractinia symbiolongicarpus]